MSSAAVEGDYATLQDAQDANGITAPMAPNWTPGEAEGFGPLTESAQVSQEMQSTLITAQWRDSAGKGYDVEIVRYDLESASTSLAAAGERNTEQYVCDGTSYYIMDTGGRHGPGPVEPGGPDRRSGRRPDGGDGGRAGPVHHPAGGRDSLYSPQPGLCAPGQQPPVHADRLPSGRPSGPHLAARRV